MSAWRAGRLALLAMPVLVLLSCSTAIPPTNYYVAGFPESPTWTTDGAKFPYTLAVARFESDEVFLRKSIVWQAEGGRLGYYSYDKWAETPAEMFSRLLYQRAYESDLFRHALWGLTSGEADLILSGRIISFEEFDTPERWFGKVQVHVELSKNDGTVLWTGIVGHSEPAEEESAKAVVKAITDSAEATIASILLSVEQALTEKQPK